MIIDGILQSSVTGVEKDGKISKQSRFIIGGNEQEMKNFYVSMHNLNVWDKVGSSNIGTVRAPFLRGSKGEQGGVRCMRGSKGE